MKLPVKVNPDKTGGTDVNSIGLATACSLRCSRTAVHIHAFHLSLLQDVSDMVQLRTTNDKA